MEKSVYQDYDSDSDVPEELKQDYVDEQTGDAPLKRSVPSQIVVDHPEGVQLYRNVRPFYSLLLKMYETKWT